MAFIMWIENCVLSPQGGGGLYGWTLLSNKPNDDLIGTIHQGDMYSISLNGERKSFSGTLQGCHSYQNGWGWHCNEITVDVSKSVVTDHPNLYKIYAGVTDILPVKERMKSFPKRGDLTLPVGSTDGWVGILNYKSSGYLNQKINWNLYAFSLIESLKIKPGLLVIPQEGWFPITLEKSISFGKLLHLHND